MKRPLRSRGSVLIVVMWVCLGLVSITLLFGHSMLMAYRGSDNDLSGRQADQAVDGAARYAQSLLLASETAGQLPELSTYENNAVPVGEATFWIIGRPEKTVQSEQPSFGLVDEASKLNINTATAGMLEGLPNMTAELAAAIVDWRDTNDDVSPNGAESETYMLQQPSYDAKNAPFESIEELAFLNGGYPEVLYGEDANLNGVLDPNENDGDKSLPSDNADGKLDAGILEYVTCFSREPNKRKDGTARVNVGSLSVALNTLLTENFSSARAAEIQQNLGTARTRSVLEFYVRGRLTPDEFNKISDAITTSGGDFLTGRVNINTASEEVLACIPGIGLEKAPTVAATRLTRGTQDTSILWIVEILGEAGAIQAGPYITGQSRQVSADVAAVGHHGRGYRRARFVIDTTEEQPRIIYRRNLAPLGWALGTEIRDALAANQDLR